MADRQPQKRSLPALSLLPPQLAAFYADNPQATGMLQNAQMLNGLALAASWQQGLEAGEQLQLFKPMRPVAQVASQNDVSNVEPGSLPNRLAKRDLMEQAEALAARKRSKSENTLTALEDHDGFQAASPQARGKRASDSGRLSLSREQAREDAEEEEEAGKVDTDDLGGLQDDREIKRIRRKQSNRESARRSRLRKQRESEALSSSVAGLRQENQQLKEANRTLQMKLDELSEQIAQANVGKNVSPRTNLAQKLSAFQVVQRKSSDGRSTDSHTHSLQPTLGLMPSKEIT